MHFEREREREYLGRVAAGRGKVVIWLPETLDYHAPVKVAIRKRIPVNELEVKYH